MKKPFFYIMPRTSSTSLIQFLRCCYGRNRVFVTKILEDIYNGVPVSSNCASPSIEKLKADLHNHHSYDAFVVMSPFGVHECINEDLSLYVTLREPVDRCISLIRFMRMNPDLNQINKKVASYGDDISDMLLDPTLLCLRNEQTRMIGNISTWELNDDSLQKAKNNLGKFTDVLLFNDIDRIEHIVQYHSSNSTDSYPRLNGAPININLEKSAVSSLRAHNRLDTALYCLGRNIGGRKYG